MNNKIITSFLILGFFSSTLLYSRIVTDDPPAHKYVGAKICGICHSKKDFGQQLKIWQQSSHAQAYKTLQTEEANKIAKELGFNEKAVELEECLKCHASGYNVDKSLLAKKFKVEDGVQCETCHGAGGDYKRKKIMQNKDKAIEKGLIVPDSIEKFCKTCHNAESPKFKGFNFEEMWKKIEHPIPTKN